MDFNPGFVFDDAEGRHVTHPWTFAGALSQAQKLDPSQTTVDEKIKAKLIRTPTQAGRRPQVADSGSDDEDDAEYEDALDDESDALPGEVDEDSGSEVEESEEDSDGDDDAATPEPARTAGGMSKQHSEQQSGPNVDEHTGGGSRSQGDDGVAIAAALRKLTGANEDMQAAEHTAAGLDEVSSDVGSMPSASEHDSSADEGDHVDASEQDEESPGDAGGDVDSSNKDSASEKETSVDDRAGEGGALANGSAAVDGGTGKAFFAQAPKGTSFSTKSFMDLGLSRPLIKAVTELGFVAPTPIQAAVVPLALLGRDIVASAITGSGKTAAFTLPMLERLLFRQRRVAATHVLVLAPTRELAAQVHSMICQLARFTDVRAALVVGGLSVSQQAAELRTAPEVVVGTPGRVIDHVLNTMAFDLDTLSALVLDEADRLLECGFQDELRQIVKRSPRKRQTLLFSATMNSGVNQLVDLSLSSPVRLAADAAAAAPKRLRHEVLRLRGGAAAADKPAALCALCARTLRGFRTIIFCRQKRQAHRLKILMGLAGLPQASELHGDMTQAARLEALEQFRTGSASLLLATDVAARGLDILGVDAVVNYDCPRTVETYLHRVGRTARAGRGGLAMSLMEDPDRALAKAIVRQVGVQLARREVPRAIIDGWRRRVEGLSGAIEEVIQEEKTEKTLRMAEMEATRASNMVEHEQEIFSRPRREWFQSTKEKKAAAKAVAQAAAMVPADAAEAPTSKKSAKAAKNAEAKGNNTQDVKAPPSHTSETKNVMGAVKAAKSAARQFQRSGSKPREAAKAALTATGAVKQKQQKKRGREGTAEDSAPPPEKLQRTTHVYSGGGKSSKLQLPRTGLSKTQKAKVARKGKGKSQFKGKTRYKRK